MSHKTAGRLASLRGALFFAVGLVGMLLVGWVAFPRALYTSHEQPLQFSHVVHTNDAGLGCSDCHALAEDGSFSGIPLLAKCADCHSDVQGKSPDEQKLVDAYVKKGLEVPWLVYARQPDNVHFPHAPHLALARIGCEECHGDHGKTTSLRPLEVNRISTYSRDIWGPSMLRDNSNGRGMKMTDCSSCHAERGVVESCGTCHK